MVERPPYGSILTRKELYMEIVLRDGTTLGRQSFRIKLKGQEFLIREDADGLYISKVESDKGKDVITIQPKVANSIVID